MHDTSNDQQYVDENGNPIDDAAYYGEEEQQLIQGAFCSK